MVFDAMTQTRGGYFFDEFDAIGTDRGSKNDSKLISGELPVPDAEKLLEGVE